MAILKRKLFWDDGSNNDHGVPGWNINPEDPESMPMGGLGLAHDILEHVNIHAEGWSTEDELRAFGAMIFIRYEGEYDYQGPYNHAQRLGMDMGGIAYDEVIMKGAETTLKTNSFEIEDIDHIIDDAIILAKKFIVNEYNPKDDEFAQRQIAESTPQLRAFFRSAKAYIHEGYLRAKNGLFANHCPYMAYTLFKELAAAIDKVGEGDYSGQRVDVVVDTDELTCNVEIREFYDMAY